MKTRRKTLVSALDTLSKLARGATRAFHGPGSRRSASWTIDTWVGTIDALLPSPTSRANIPVACVAEASHNSDVRRLEQIVWILPVHDFVLADDSTGADNNESEIGAGPEAAVLAVAKDVWRRDHTSLREGVRISELRAVGDHAHGEFFRGPSRSRVHRIADGRPLAREHDFIYLG